MKFIWKKGIWIFVLIGLAVNPFVQDTPAGWSNEKTGIWRGGTGYWSQRQKWDLNYRYAITPGPGFTVFIRKDGRVYLDKDVAIEKLTIGKADSPFTPASRSGFDIDRFHSRKMKEWTI